MSAGSYFDELSVRAAALKKTLAVLDLEEEVSVARAAADREAYEASMKVWERIVLVLAGSAEPMSTADVRDALVAEGFQATRDLVARTCKTQAARLPEHRMIDRADNGARDQCMWMLTDHGRSYADALRA